MRTKQRMVVIILMFIMILPLRAFAAEDPMSSAYFYKAYNSTGNRLVGVIPALNDEIPQTRDWQLTRWTGIITFPNSAKVSVPNYDVFNVKREPDDPNFDKENGFGLVYKMPQALGELLDAFTKGQRDNNISDAQWKYYRDQFMQNASDEMLKADHPWYYSIGRSYEFLRTSGIIQRAGFKFNQTYKVNENERQALYTASKWPQIKSTPILDVTKGKAKAFKVQYIVSGWIDRNINVIAIPTGVFPDTHNKISLTGGKNISVAGATVSGTIDIEDISTLTKLGNKVDIILDDGFGRTAITTLNLEDGFKTPPIDFEDITSTEGTPVWPPLPEETVDHYDLICSNDNTKHNVGKNFRYPLSGLTPETEYHCSLEAFDPEGNSGGVEEGSFTTLPENEDVPVPDGEAGSGGQWKSIGLIREINSEKQYDKDPSPGALKPIPSTKYPTKVEEYKAFASNKALANTNTPYFGEKLGAYATPETKSGSYKWKFSYIVKETYKKCKGTGDNRKCETKERDVTKYAYDSCTIDYASMGLPGWDGTSIKSNPNGKSGEVTTKWGKKGTIKVTDVDQRSCTGSDSRNKSKHQFDYYVPTEVSISPSLLLDKGFNPTYQTIDSAQKDQWLRIPSQKYKVDTVTDNETASTTIHAVGAANATMGQIDFKMLWSRYGNVGTGK